MGLCPYVIWIQVNWKVNVELGVILGVSIFLIDEPYPHRVIHVGYQLLLIEHIETDCLPLAEVDDYLI